MNTISLPRSTYSEILKRQARADAAIARLQKAIVELAQDELRPEVATRIERRSKSLDAGKGKRLKTMREIHSYFRAL